MRKAEVYRNGILTGCLTEENRNKYVFRYEAGYFADHEKPSIALTLPKRQQEHLCDHIFPFFFNMLSEGANRKLQSVQLKIDELDDFGLLLATAQHDTIGAITIKPIEND